MPRGEGPSPNRVTTTRVFPVACPICGGCGTVPPDFYVRTGTSTSANRTTCRTCDGRGTVSATETTTTGRFL